MKTHIEELQSQKDEIAEMLRQLYKMQSRLMRIKNGLQREISKETRKRKDVVENEQQTRLF